MAQGKTVILDVSATWCGPCWGYHDSHTLADLYNAYGPNGSDEVMVFMVEGDGSTTQADLEGTGSSTQGDWLKDTPYPIIDKASIANAYQIAFYPTIFRICPDGKVYEEGANPINVLVSSIGSNCGQSLTGAENHAEVKGQDVFSCGGSVAMTVPFVNYGSNAITSADVVIKQLDGAELASQSFSGNLAQFGEGVVEFTDLTLYSGYSYIAELQNVNGSSIFDSPSAPDMFWNGATSIIDVTGAPWAHLTVQLEVFTDNYPSETSWAIKSSDGSTIATGGPYQAGTDDGFGAGGPDALTTKTHIIDLPAGTDCYSVEMYDNFGDGLSYGANPAGQFGWEISSYGIIVSNVNPGEFGAVYVSDAAFRTDQNSAISENNVSNINVYPNPAADVVNISMENVSSETSVAIMDLQGRILATQSASSTNGTQVITFATEGFAKGTYVVSVRANGLTSNTNVVIK